MPGLFGSDIERGEEQGSEPVGESVAAALAPGPAGAPPLSARAGSEHRAAILPFALDGEVVRYAGDLRGLSALDETRETRSVRLGVLANVAAALGSLHEEGRVHGDVRPASILSAGPLRHTLLAPGQPLDAPALLSARLSVGAPPSSVAFAAPEVALGEAATPASDVYALAALAHWVLTGTPPLGRPAPGVVSRGLSVHAVRTLTTALRADPEARPTMAALEEVLREASAADLPEPVAVAPAAPPTEAEKKGSQVSALLVVVLVLGGSFVFCGALGLVIAGWSSLPGAAQFLLLTGFTAAVWGLGAVLARRGYTRSGFTLSVLGSQLLWVNLVHLLVLTDLHNSEGAWALGSAALSLLYFGLAIRRSSVVFGSLTVLGFLVTALATGEFLSSGSRYGPLVYFTLVAGAYAGLAALGHRLAARPTILGVPLAAGAAIWTWIAACVSLALLERHHGVLETVWLYGLGIAACGLALRLPRIYRILALVCGGAILSVGPTAQALLNFKSLPYLLWVVGLGLIILAAAFHVARIAENPAAQIVTVLLGLCDVLFAPFIVCLERCFDRDGLGLLQEALESVGRVHETRFVYLSIPVGTSLGLVALGFLFSRDAKRKAAYRLLEVAGLLNFFCLLTLLSLPDVDDEFFYLSLIVGGAAASLALGVWARRAVLVSIASVALLLNLFIQYFAKLSQVVHWGLLSLGFGVAILGLAILYERQVKHLLPKLKEWA